MKEYNLSPEQTGDIIDVMFSVLKRSGNELFDFSDDSSISTEETYQTMIESFKRRNMNEEVNFIKNLL